MVIKFRQIRKEDFKEVYKLALKGWFFAYSYLHRKDIKNLVDEYFSNSELEKALENVKSGKGNYNLAFEKDELVGFCEMIIRNTGGELNELYVDPKRIRQGLGGKLLSMGEEFLVSKGIEKYFTFCNRHNKIGYNFYIKNGFEYRPEKDRDDEFESKALMCLEKTLPQKL